MAKTVKEKGVLTQFGKELRKIRIDRDQTLQDMAGELGMSSVKLANIEFGRIPVSNRLLEIIVGMYAEDEAHAQKLTNASALSTPALTFHRHEMSAEDWETLVELHRMVMEKRGESVVDATQDDLPETELEEAAKAGEEFVPECCATSEAEDDELEILKELESL
ncbi:helix-turn-helix domain-containing protein [Ectothiorhodospira shaposhnikovii]|uniref:helix-turn-helix domain-containing protein n=1 Tax=Ectothiorhodospira shaposhnikovii TaxID=1054 RepID=UPI001EE8E2E9|nr:helix-turn-helix transcriptional regulator [Ectothiorhodospira shaposhnikovii]MCG5512798.1 helix-turn-helix domain-containing protein [Ectothiorhodospira shaposhnikovii]